jgi:hypothetical protein
MHTNGDYDDTAPAMNLLPVQWSDEESGYGPEVWQEAAHCSAQRIDSECLFGNTCNRIFTDYSSVVGCYPQQGQRCFNDGAPCGHQLINDFEMWVRPDLGSVEAAVAYGSFTGGDPGEGLDFAGDFLYAVNILGPGGGRIGDVTFTADDTPGFTITAQNAIIDWADTEFGDSDNDNVLEQVMNSIRWSAHPVSVDVQLDRLSVGQD